jgi:hypothetical protein
MESSNVGLESLFVVECSKLVALALVELVLELDPMKTECMQEAFHHVHGHQDSHSEGNPEEVSYPHTKEGASYRMSFEGRHNGVFKEDSRQLTMSKGEGPQTQIGSSIGDGTQDELNGLDQLVDKDIGEGTMSFLR